MASFNSVRAKADNRANVRKALGAVLFLAPADAEPVTTLVGPDKSLAEVPADYVPVGLVSEDGMSFGRDAENEEVNALGYRTPVRRDWTSDIHSITVNVLEVDKKAIAEVRYGIDLSNVKAGTNGEIKFDVPEIVASKQYRLLAIAQDLNKTTGAEIYRGKFFYNVEISEFPSEEWSNDAMALELTFEARPDEETALTLTEFIAGPGLDPADLGYTAA